MEIKEFDGMDKVSLELYARRRIRKIRMKEKR